MVAVLPVKVKDGEKTWEEMQLFDTNKSTKVCQVINAFGNPVQEIYLSPGGTLFVKEIREKKLSVADQAAAKKYIGEHYPEKYIKHFGAVKEA